MLDKKVRQFTETIEESLDDIAPYRTFTIKSEYKFGLSSETKDLMAKRDQTRKKLSSADQNERLILLAKYKKLRNLINNRIRSETRNFNNSRIEAAKMRMRCGMW